MQAKYTDKGGNEMQEQISGEQLLEIICGCYILIVFFLVILSAPTNEDKENLAKKIAVGFSMFAIGYFSKKEKMDEKESITSQLGHYRNGASK